MTLSNYSRVLYYCLLAVIWSTRVKPMYSLHRLDQMCKHFLCFFGCFFGLFFNPFFNCLHATFRDTTNNISLGVAPCFALPRIRTFRLLRRPVLIPVVFRQAVSRLKARFRLLTACLKDLYIKKSSAVNTLAEDFVFHKYMRNAPHGVSPFSRHHFLNSSDLAKPRKT